MSHHSNENQDLLETPDVGQLQRIPLPDDEIDIEDTKNQQGSTEGNDLLHHPTDSIMDNTENDRKDPHIDNEDDPVTHETCMRCFLNAYEGNWKQLIITTDDRLNQAKPPERGDWICFVPPRA